MKESLYIKRDNYFRTYLYEGAFLDGKFGFPRLQRSDCIASNPISFVECRTKARKYDRWLHFYAEDLNFECVWNNPTREENELAEKIMKVKIKNG